MDTDTIFALATPSGTSGVAVIRVSGPQARQTLLSLSQSAPSPRKAALATLRHPHTRDLIDRGLVLWFPGPRSFTGEDVVEFQIHGGVALIKALTDALLALNCRPAHRGEFSRRALDRGKMDLLDVEGLDQLIRAQDEANLKLAQGQLGHQWRQQFDMWREMLARLQAACEALIDFPDDDLPKDLLASNAQALKKLSEEAQALENRSALAQSLHQGLEILIVGPPNAGKSTLLNALAGYERAIVTAHPGTTRDFVELNLQLGPFQVTFVDTAGLRETKDVVEQQGVTRTKDRFKSAALILNLFDPNQTPQKIAATCPIWPVQTKGWIEKKRSIAAGDVGQAGVENLLIEILDFLQETYGSILNDISFQRERQLFHVKQFSKSLQEAQDLSLLPEMQAENLRQAASALAHLSGKIHVEEVLDELFSGFCIGK